MASTTWKSPIYRFNLPSRPIVVNVTRSCPPFAKPAPAVSDIAAELRRDGRKRVLDFGAGKLRNTLFLLSLKAGFKVWAVEYKDCFETLRGTERLNEAKGYNKDDKRFFLKKWPDEFLQSNFVVDAVLLINVVNVVPQVSVRRRIVEECTKRLRKGGWFLWLSQFGEPNNRPGATDRLRGPDNGWFYYLDKTHQTYSKEFSIPEIKAYFSPSEYTEVHPVSAAHHRAFLFEKL